MSQVYCYICTRSTVDPVVHARATSLDVLARDCSDGFLSLAGGYQVVGRLAFFSVQRAVPNHLLCDGSEVPQSSFPELYGLIGDSEGAATAGFFKLPDYTGGLEAAPTPAAETVVAGTVTAPMPAPSEAVPVLDPKNYRTDSGGRFYRTGYEVEE